MFQIHSFSFFYSYLVAALTLTEIFDWPITVLGKGKFSLIARFHEIRVHIADLLTICTKGSTRCKSPLVKWCAYIYIYIYIFFLIPANDEQLTKNLLVDPTS